MFNTENVSRESLDALNGILWFLALTPIAMGLHYAAKYYNEFWYTPMGWFIATLGAVQLGFGLARGGSRLFRIPITFKTPLSS